MSYGVHVPLTKAERDKLRALARAERRYPRDQAAVILTQALAALPESSEDTHAPPRGGSPPDLPHTPSAGPIEVRP